MKKSILTFASLFALTVVSAQSYPKQPDPKIYVVTDNSAKKTETQATTNAGQQATDADNANDQATENTAQSQEAVSHNKVAVNRREDGATRD